MHNPRGEQCRKPAETRHKTTVSEGHVHGNGAGLTCIGLQCSVPKHATESLPRVVRAQPGHRWPHRHSVPDRPTLSEDGKPQTDRHRRDRQQHIAGPRPEHRRAALLHRHTQHRRAHQQRVAGRQHVSLHKCHAGPRHLSRTGSHLRMGHRPGGAHPVLLAGQYLPDSKTVRQRHLR